MVLFRILRKRAEALHWGPNQYHHFANLNVREPLTVLWISADEGKAQTILRAHCKFTFVLFVYWVARNYFLKHWQKRSRAAASGMKNLCARWVTSRPSASGWQLAAVRRSCLLCCSATPVCVGASVRSVLRRSWFWFSPLGKCCLFSCVL